MLTAFSASLLVTLASDLKAAQSSFDIISVVPGSIVVTITLPVPLVALLQSIVQSGSLVVDFLNESLHVDPNSFVINPIVPTPAASTSKSGSGIALGVGLAVGIAALVTAVVVAVMLMQRRRKRSLALKDAANHSVLVDATAINTSHSSTPDTSITPTHPMVNPVYEAAAISAPPPKALVLPSTFDNPLYDDTLVELVRRDETSVMQDKVAPPPRLSLRTWLNEVVTGDDSTV